VRGGIIPDMINSWWCCPRNAYDSVRQRLYVSGTDRGGTQRIGYIDTRHGGAQTSVADRLSVLPDDHNVPAMLVQGDKPIVAAYSRHSADSVMRVRVGGTPHSIDTLGTEVEIAMNHPTSYAHVLRKPGSNELAIICRQQPVDATPAHWAIVRSTDYGATWGSQIELHRKLYTHHRLSSDGLFAYFMLATHPGVGSANAEINYFRVDLTTGEMRNRAGTVFTDNFWSTTTPTSTVLCPTASLTTVRAITNGSVTRDKVRGFDVEQNGAVAYGELDYEDPAAGVNYRVARWNGSAYVNYDLVNSGVPFGYDVSHYVGGMCFGVDHNTVYLVRESSGTWTLERWAWTGSGYAHAATLITGTEKLGRPQVPWNNPSSGIVMVGRYHRYTSGGYNDYMADQLYLVDTP
jgi:hypothetical protein